MYKIDEYYESFVRITKLSNKRTKELTNWFNKQNILVKNDVFIEQKKFYFKLKNEGVAIDYLPICSFYLAIEKLTKTDLLSLKNKSENIERLQKVSINSIKRFRRISIKEKREKLLNLWSVIQTLKEKGFSFREISRYLKSKHRFEVSHSYIHQTWKEVENEF